MLPWDKLMPPEKGTLLKKDGWDLTPQSYIDYFNLHKKYEKVQKEYPIESTLWNPDEVFESLLKSVA
jgi:hypothetical protein